MMMYILLIVSFFSLADGQANADFKYVHNCYSEGQTLTLEAVYNGSGTESLVQWSYSGKTGTSLMIKVSDCTVLGSVPEGYPPAARMDYMCAIKDSLPANTYRLTLSGLTTDELTKSWGATFTPISGTIPAAVEEAIPVCKATTPSTTTSATPTIASSTPVPTSSTSTTTSSSAVIKQTTSPSSGNETTVIIVSSVLGGLFLVGIVITIVLMLLSQRRGHQSVKHARNHRHRDQDQRHKRRDNHRYPSWQDYGHNNNASYIEYSEMGTTMNPLYVPYRSAHRAERNNYLDHPSSDHQSHTRNNHIIYGGYNSNMRPQTDMHSYQPRYYGGRGGNNISSTLPRDENNYVAPDYELYW